MYAYETDEKEVRKLKGVKNVYEAFILDKKYCSINKGLIEAIKMK
jgi:hypothetical protein